MHPNSDRRNGNIFVWSFLLVYLSAPVRYIGIAQAALCDKLGSSALVSNLPTAGYFFAAIGPIFFAYLVPNRWQLKAVIWSGWGITVLSGLAAAVLFLPFPNEVRVAVIVVQSLLLGILSSGQQLFLLQCLGRGTTDNGRARALKLAFSLGPLGAVAGSLGAQFILNGGFHWLSFPRDFGVLYLVGSVCSVAMLWKCTEFDLPPIVDVAPTRFFLFLKESIGRFVHSRDMAYLWLAYFMWYATFLVLPNLTLFARHAMGREPADFSGLMMAIQFGSKAVAGYACGVLYQRYGVRAPLVATVMALGGSLLWAWAVPGYYYLAAFALMGAGQLGGFYFPIVLLSWSSSANAARDMAVLNLSVVVASPAPALHGWVTDRWGFPASFVLGILTAVMGLVLVLRLSTRRDREVSLPPA